MVKQKQVPITSSRGGIRVAVKDLDRDGHGDLVVASGTEARSEVRVARGSDLLDGADEADLQRLDVIRTGFLGGVFVG